MPEPIVLAEDLGRIFGFEETEAIALKGASFCIESAELIALSGPSGSGKSTLLHLIGGIDTPTSGAISWPALGPKSSLRPAQVVNVFQGPSLIPPISVLDNVELPMLLAGLSLIESNGRALEALHRLQIEHLAKKLPEEISGGEAQRVAIARALAIQPQLILADEPTGQLDSETASQVMEILLSATRELGAALILSTHDPRISARLPIQWRIESGQLATGSESRQEPQSAIV